MNRPAHRQRFRTPIATRFHLAPLLLALAMVLLAGCRDQQAAQAPAPVHTPEAKVITLLAFAEDMPDSVLHSFAGETGIQVQIRPFQSPEEAEADIRSRQPFDVALIENQLFPGLIREGLLAELDPAALPNFKNIAANFRDLAFDPGNRYSVPASYGTTGLIVRTDLLAEPVRRWADLWRPCHAGRIGLRAQPREVIGLTLLTLGYAANSDNPAELEAALQRLVTLKPSMVLLDIEADDAADRLLRGEIAILHGYAEDYQLARAGHADVAYVLPAEGTALWGESYAIPRSSTHRQEAEAFINFLLRPENTARIINEKKYAQANEAALALVRPELRHDPVIFPTNRELAQGFLIQPLSPEGQQRYNDLWNRFLATPTRRAH